MLPPPTLLGVPPGPAAQAWGQWLQTQELAPFGSAPTCSRQELGQHPDWIRVHAVPSPGRSLQEGGRSRARRQRADPAKCSCSVALAPRRGGRPGWGAWGAVEPRLEVGGFVPIASAHRWLLSPRWGLQAGLGEEATLWWASLSPPPSVPSHLGELGRIPGAKQVFSVPCKGRRVTDSLPASPPCPGTWNLAVVVGHCQLLGADFKNKR